MQLFACPFCGLRSETEFHFAGDAGNDRPQGFDAVTAERWSDYLHNRNNPRGPSNEIWIHLTCSEAFRMERDTTHHGVLMSRELTREDHE
ncbi:sarcosine oxidase subunit delta [Rhizobium leguminosarum]|uniref:sarcosine oxidase subunit delta n=1 Tax=Rhizobium leguminosarum TaxID=384 RepID=UPI00143F5948|nr:sarcosine oxidase subunit delta [Rhizobium leguminosarum]NKL21269.1 sarcosine oxidase subunit delta [Rhizobium leguminosarum bv. viciae]NKL56775.1 sarcosine oxidase subunit delta [Rhizobium leguminosarum bv. viciae]